MRFSRYAAVVITVGAVSVALTNGCNCGSPPVAIGGGPDECAQDAECADGERCVDGSCVLTDADGGTSTNDDPDAGTGTDDGGTSPDGGSNDGGTSCENDGDC